MKEYKLLSLLLVSVALFSCSTVRHSATSESQVDSLSAVRFNEVFRNGGWKLLHSYSIYANDSIGNIDWEDSEGGGSPPLLAWRNDSLYYFFYWLDVASFNTKHLYKVGTYEYDEGEHLFRIKKFPFSVFWKDLKEFKITSISNERIKCEGPVYPLVVDKSTQKCLFIFERAEDDSVESWFKDCGLNY